MYTVLLLLALRTYPCSSSYYRFRYVVRKFAEALETIPMALAENSGLPAIDTLAQLKAAQIKVRRLRSVATRFVAVSALCSVFFCLVYSFVLAAC